MKRPTRTDVAKRVGVSIATVSYAFSNSDKISTETRKAVLLAARELGYHPSQVARSLSTHRTMQLSLIFNDIANPVYSDLIAGFENAAIERGYFVNICNGKTHVDEYFQHVLSRNIDGIMIEVLPHKFHTERIIDLLRSGTKVVLFGDHGIDTTGAACFEIDYVKGMDLAVDHLFALGHRRIAYLSGLSEKDGYDRRIPGFRQAMRTRGLGEGLVAAPPSSLSTSIEDGETMARELLDHGGVFTALICTNDTMAIGAMRILASRGIEVPGMVSVVGIDDAYVASIVSPGLTTIGSDYIELGGIAFGLLYDAMVDDRFGYVLYEPHLVVRESTGRCLESRS
jgi:DNA-binding LacI/PurR family transcriptional regulator